MQLQTGDRHQSVFHTIPAGHVPDPSEGVLPCLPAAIFKDALRIKRRTAVLKSPTDLAWHDPRVPAYQLKNRAAVDLSEINLECIIIDDRKRNRCGQGG